MTKVWEKGKEEEGEEQKDQGRSSFNTDPQSCYDGVIEYKVRNKGSELFSLLSWKTKERMQSKVSWAV